MPKVQTNFQWRVIPRKFALEALNMYFLTIFKNIAQQTEGGYPPLFKVWGLTSY
jgi:hypothetical protein